MKVVKFQTKSGTTRFKLELTESEYHRAENDYLGHCIACGSEAWECEPDARGYECDCCGENKVFGIPELLMAGWVRLVEPSETATQSA